MIKIIERFLKEYPGKAVDPKEKAHFRLSGMGFECQAYDLEGLGRLSYLKAASFLSLMKMDSLIIAASKKDLPLMNIDRMKIMGRQMLYLELYDTGEGPELKEVFSRVKEQFKQYETPQSEKRWYDDIRYPQSIIIRQADNALIEEVIQAYVDAYLECAAKTQACDPQKKLAAVRAYSHSLAEKGGPATDAFIKKWGQEKTRQFLDDVLFG